MKTTTKTLQLAKLCTVGLQARVQLNHDTVLEYAEKLKEGVKLPEVDVFSDGETFWLADGFHRVEAHTLAGKKTIEAIIHEGDQEDAVWFACGANQKHGLRRTSADKRKAVVLALKLRPDNSNVLIAKHVGVDDKTVASVRKELDEAEQASSSPENQQTENNSTSEIPRLSPGDAPKRLGADGKLRKAPIKKKILDMLGREVPKEVMASWLRRDEVKNHFKAVSAVRLAMERAQESEDILYAVTTFSSLIAYLRSAQKSLEASIPFTVCPTCQGKQRDGCRLCMGLGLISEFRWDHTVSDEMKKLILGK